MNKIVFFLLVLIFTRMGVSFGSDPTPLAIGDFFVGGNATNISDANENQLLGLLVGPEGAPGPAGTAGKNGFNGINGINGMPGAPGPMGLPGPQGPAGQQGTPGLNGAQGAKGDTGAQGPKGDTGAQGPQGVPGPAGGSGGTGSAPFAGGPVAVVVCGNSDTDPGLGFAINPQFDGSNFKIASIDVKHIASTCKGLTLSFYFKMKQSRASHYLADSIITCSHALSAADLPSTHNNMSFSDANLACTAEPSIGTPVHLADLYIKDLDGTGDTNIGITIS